MCKRKRKRTKRRRQGEKDKSKKGRVEERMKRSGVKGR